MPHSLRDPALQFDDVLGRARLNAAPASNAAIGLDHVRLLVAVDPSPEPAEERQETLVFGSQRADLKNRVGTRRNAGGLGITTTGMEAALVMIWSDVMERISGCATAKSAAQHGKAFGGRGGGEG